MKLLACLILALLPVAGCEDNKKSAEVAKVGHQIRLHRAAKRAKATPTPVPTATATTVYTPSPIATVQNITAAAAFTAAPIPELISPLPTATQTSAAIEQIADEGVDSLLADLALLGEDEQVVMNERPGRGSLVAGVRIRRQSQPVAEPQGGWTEVEEHDDDYLGEAWSYGGLVGGQSRGYMMLYLMHPKARLTVEKQVDAMLRAGVRDLYLGVLVDGTFSFDFDYLTDVVRRLAAANRSLKLALYLSNGPAMRRYQSYRGEYAFRGISPQDFRSRVRYDVRVRNEFLALAREAKPVFDLNKQLDDDNSNIAVVMLEDNLNRASYKAMRDLAYSVLGDSVRYIRNPCIGCFDGNDMDSLGDGLEFHDAGELVLAGERDGFTLDGSGYYFTGEPRNGFSLDDVRFLVEEATGRGLRYFGLWRAQRQGIFGEDLAHPDQREYEVPTDNQIAEEIKLLRHGLAG